MQLKRFMRASAAAATLAVGGVAAVPAVASASATAVTGTGSSLVAPLAAEWASQYTLTQTSYAFSYTPTSSGTGILYSQNGTDNFGGSDMPLYGTDGAYANYKNGVLQIPWALTGTIVGYHLSSLKLPKGQYSLHLTGTVLAKIYTGKISYWNDPAIKALNPGASIPGTKITPVLRSGSSGDSYAFESFMYASDRADWNYAPAGTWPVAGTGIAETGNAGLAAEVEATNGAIGYVALPYLIAAGTSNPDIVEAGIKNAAGRYEYANEGNIADAALSFSNPPAQGASFGMPITYPSPAYKFAYPISTFTYALLPEGQGSTIESALQGFVTYAVGSGGQQWAPRLGFVPLTNVTYKYVDPYTVTTTVKVKKGKKTVKVKKTVTKYNSVTANLAKIAAYDKAQLGAL